MAKRGVDDRGVRHGKDELLGPDAGQLLVLGAEAVVGGGVELEDRLQVRVVDGEAGQALSPAGR